MDDHEIRAAYERLSAGATPPPGVRQHVAARVARRRRHRTTAAVAAAVLVVGGTAGTAAALRDGSVERTDPVAEPTPVPPEVPTALTCPTDRRNVSAPPVGVIPPLPDDPTTADLGFVRPGEHLVLASAGREARLWVVRPDGTARAFVSIERRSGAWTWDGSSTMCADEPDLREELRCGDEPVVTGTLSQPSLGGARDEEDATWPWRGPDDLLHAGGPPGDGQVDVAIVPPDDRVQVVLRIERGDDDLWRVAALAACAAAVPGLPTTGEDLALVALSVGHCWVETLTYDGRDWEVRDEDQFGTGGGQPDGFRSMGTVTVGGDLLTYVDASGARLELVPAAAPGTAANERGCR